VSARLTIAQHAARRSGAVMRVLETYEERYRVQNRKVPDDAPAEVLDRQERLWDATWQLHVDICAALDRCEAAERRARWGNDERQRP
jgi:hypothetical protein